MSRCENPLVNQKRKTSYGKKRWRYRSRNPRSGRDRFDRLCDVEFAGGRRLDGAGRRRRLHRVADGDHRLVPGLSAVRHENLQSEINFRFVSVSCKVRPSGALFILENFMRILFLLFALALAGAANAGGVERLKAFIAGAKTAEADFTQTVADKTGRVTQQASGKMAFARPGKFRWDYRAPYEQVIVGDGTRLWLYDTDLEQVTVKPLGDVIAGTPAALLAGDNAIEKYFSLKNAGEGDGLEWLEATPKTRDTTFERIRMGFKGDVLVQMELFDFFGQRTTLKLSNFARNPAIAPSRFTFTPPKGADIIGE